MRHGQRGAGWPVVTGGACGILRFFGQIIATKVTPSGGLVKESTPKCRQFKFGHIVICRDFFPSLFGCSTSAFYLGSSKLILNPYEDYG